LTAEVDRPECWCSIAAYRSTKVEQEQAVPAVTESPIPTTTTGEVSRAEVVGAAPGAAEGALGPEVAGSAATTLLAQPLVASRRAARTHGVVSRLQGSGTRAG
jgi:hypothetical protein